MPDAARAGRGSIPTGDTGNSSARLRRRGFIRAYLADPTRNGTAAAIAAGYSKRSAKSQAHELLNDPRIQRAIEAADRPNRHRYDLTAKRVLREVATLAFSNVTDYTIAANGDISPAPDVSARALRAVSSVERRTNVTLGADGKPARVQREVKLRMWDKTKALGMAMKHLGLLIERVEVTKRDPQTWMIGGKSITF